MKIRILAIALAVLMLAGCSGQGENPSGGANQMDLAAVYAQMEPNMPEMITLDATMMLNYCGIQEADCAQAVVVICADGLRTDEVWLIEATDADALARLKALSDSRLAQKAEESESYSPEQYAVVQKAQVITAGNYLAVLVSPDVDTLAQLFRTAAGI